MEAGGLTPEAGGWRLEAGGWRLEAWRVVPGTGGTGTARLEATVIVLPSVSVYLPQLMSGP